MNHHRLIKILFVPFAIVPLVIFLLCEVVASDRDDRIVPPKQDGFTINISNAHDVCGVSKAVNDLIAEGFTIKGMMCVKDDNRIARIYVDKGKCKTLEDAKDILENYDSLMMVWPQIETFPVAK